MAMDPLDSIRQRWADLGPWQQTCDTPWGSKVVATDYGECFVGTSFHTTPPLPQWHESALQRAEERRQSMCRVAHAVAHAPTDVHLLLAVIDRLRSDVATLETLRALGGET